MAIEKTTGYVRAWYQFLQDTGLGKMTYFEIQESGYHVKYGIALQAFYSKIKAHSLYKKTAPSPAVQLHLLECCDMPAHFLLNGERCNNMEDVYEVIKRKAVEKYGSQWRAIKTHQQYTSIFYPQTSNMAARKLDFVAKDLYICIEIATEEVKRWHCGAWTKEFDSIL